MSEHSENSTCPNCEKEMNSCGSDRPYDYTTHMCPYCGFYVNAVTGFEEDLDTLNSTRADYDLKPLKKLPKQDKDLCSYN